MRTIKLVIIGDSGVGKTSVRSNYISGRFSTGYRATIGTDFITKVLPHYSKPEEMVTLQIWDTAGQERFSSLSTAFFRGADAVLMMYDVNNPTTLQGLRKWWKEFQEHAPVHDEEASDYCCVVVGNKIDLAEATEEGRKMTVSEEDARILLEELFPLYSSLATMHPAYDGAPLVVELDSPYGDIPHAPNGNGFAHLDDESSIDTPRPIDITYSGHESGRQSTGSRATSRSRLNGTMTSTRTGFSVYHTPSSSLFDEFMSAPSSPMHSSTPSTIIQDRGASPASNPRKSSNVSISSTSSTIRPKSSSTFPARSITLDRGPRLFLTSAKSGQGVPSVFEYIARRVVTRWEWEEYIQTRLPDSIESESEVTTVHLSHSKADDRWVKTCCS